ncbi:hypothetical protein AADZ86_11520 [Colwelliaceae bacterium BS250]
MKNRIFKNSQRRRQMKSAQRKVCGRLRVYFRVVTQNSIDLEKSNSTS